MHDADAEEKRDPRGRFERGNPGGPGRPKKQPDTKRQAEPRRLVTAAELLLLADALENRNQILAQLRRTRSPEVVARIEHLLKITDYVAGATADEDDGRAEGGSHLQ